MQTHRGIVVAGRAGVAASQPLAVSAALQILARGGSCIDAAITASAVLSVVEPWNSHLGGDAFCIHHHAATRTNMAFNGSGEAPHGATDAAFPGGIPLHGFQSATIPGLVSTWFAAHALHGRLPIATLLAPAIAYARDGFPAGPTLLKKVRDHRALLSAHASLDSLGIPVNVSLGDIIRQQELATTLEAIAQNGRAGFYGGRVADLIVETSGGWFSHDDLARHKTRILPPLAGRYRDLIVHGQPPPSQGMVLIEELLLADGYPLADLPDAQRTHLLVEAKKLAFTDRNRFLGDPEWRDIAVEQLFDTMYISRRRAEIDPFLAAGTHIALPNEGSDTTYFVIVDDAGDAISWIQSVFHNFGSAWMPAGTGVLFNNRLTGFSLDQMSPNCIAPGKRPAHTLNAWLATHLDGRLAYVGGTPGGHVQVQTNLQLLVNAVDLKMDVQQAVEAPRWQHLSTAGALSNEEAGDGILEIENRVDESIVTALKERGHDVRLIGPWAHGSAAQLMQVLPDGAYAFGSDPRCDGQAAGI